MLQLFFSDHSDYSGKQLKHMNLAFFKAGKASKRGQQTQNCRKQIHTAFRKKY